MSRSPSCSRPSAPPRMPLSASTTTRRKFPTSGSVLVPRCSLLIRRNIPGVFRFSLVTGWKGNRGEQLQTLSYEITDPTIGSQILQLQASGADLLYDASTPKFSAMAIRKVADLDWHPLHIVDSNGALVKPALESAGLDKSVGVVTAQYLKDPTDPGWAD